MMSVLRTSVRSGYPWYLSLAIVATTGILIRPGAVGHHWDWSIPIPAVELRRLAATSATAWQDFALGSFVQYRYATVVLDFLLAAPGFLGVSGAVVSKALLVLGLSSSAWAMNSFARSVLEEVVAVARAPRYAFAAGLLYGFAPFIYDEIVAGNQLGIMVYALAPVVLNLIWRIADRSRPIRASTIVWAAALLSLTSGIFQMALAIVILAVILCLSARGLRRLASLRIAILVATTAVFSSYWLFPVFFAGSPIESGIAVTPQIVADVVLRQFGDPWRTLTLSAYPGDFYVHALTGAPLWLFALAWSFAWAACSWSAITSRSSVSTALAATYIASAILPLGGAPIIGPVILAAFHALLPYSLLFRTPQHLFFLTTMTFPMLVAVGCARLRLFDKPVRYAVALACAVAISSGFIVHSDFLDLIGPFAQTAEQRATVDLLSRADDQGRLLFLPSASSFYYHPGRFDYFLEAGDDPDVRFAPLPTLAPGAKWSPYHDSQTVEKILDEQVTRPLSPDMLRLLLDIASVKYVEARDNLIPPGGVQLGRYSYRGTVRRLDRAGLFETVSSGPSTTLWKVRDPVPRVYVPDCSIGVAPTADAYRLVAWSKTLSNCRRPAFIANGSDAAIAIAGKSIVPRESEDGRLTAFGATAPSAHASAGHIRVTAFAGSNVPVRLAPDGDAILQASAGSLFVFKSGLAAAPARAVKAPAPPDRVLASIAVPAAGKYLVSIFAPDDFHRYNALVSLQQGDNVFTFSLAGMSAVGRPQPAMIDGYRVANVDPMTEDSTLRIAPPILYRAPAWKSARESDYLVKSITSRWDLYYYGYLQSRTANIDVKALGSWDLGTEFSTAKAGRYAVYAHVLQRDRPQAFAVAIDRSPASCVEREDPRAITEDELYAGTFRLERGAHVLRLGACPVERPDSLALLGIDIVPADLQRPSGGVDRLSLRRSSPSRVDASVNGPRPAYIVLADAFDEHWSATQNGRLLPHLKANGYANAWYVAQPKGGSVVIEFGPQRLLIAGYLISLASLVLAAFGAWWIGRAQRSI